MATLTIRMPDSSRDRLAAMAADRGVSLNKLIEEISTRAIAEHDTALRFRARAARGDVEKAMDILDRLDAEAER
ncbi:toxin-antitoxin system HicB family antitoxin [Psychromarinibacter sp. C21-152]|uniref:Toxin-antitoxin system HicB family antitoxin n=1 Tax=Psychromarinibacter sediminicola TaxID=3033385 RepID=A0AAE3NSF6_9RHOB|nr:toxin-antitoxin system HicB family antitoxin [Psychromarinibacter sediminicola]MDF0601171.1 toxin-antitoxin system HicB family antitoxin [Psychromarinibacter sediminicola]